MPCLKPKFFVYLGCFILLLFLPRVLPIYHLILFEIRYYILPLWPWVFNLLLRYTGLLSFGHGALFAVGAYAVGMTGEHFPDLYRIEILIPVALLASLVVSTIFGFICVRHTSSILFHTCPCRLNGHIRSFNQSLYHITGGSDGIHIELPIYVRKNPFEGMKRFEFLSGAYYYVLICVFAAATIIMLAIVNSPFGKALQCIRDNEVRAEMIGIRVRRYRLYALSFRSIYRIRRGNVEFCQWPCYP